VSVERLKREWIKHANAWFPDRQILVRGPGRVVALHLPQRRQIAAAAAVTISALWITCSSLAVTFSWGGRAAAAHSQAQLQAQLARARAQLQAVIAQNSAMAAERDAAVAQAAQVKTQALTHVAAARAAAAAQVAGLNRQTEAAIAQVEGIIKQTGLNPSRLAQSGGLGNGPAEAHVPDGAELLQRDLGALHALSGVLGQMPLASPVADMSISSGYGYRASPFTGAREFHVGIDLRGPIGSPIYATAPGRVSFAGVETGYGLIVVIDHGYGLSTRYSHLEKMLVHVGDHVGLHEEVGLMGNTGWSTGPHLLYETRVDGLPDNPLNFIKVSQNDLQN
jgi:murein DD-endopeptidase MepM/ murein hydrolase activator NlpD